MPKARRCPASFASFIDSTSPDGAATEENAVLRATGKTAAVRRENVLRPFAYRVEGGDDRSMTWMNVEVVEPPAVESLAVKLFPPPYTGWPAEKSDGNLRALVGTRIEIQAKATKPLKSAKLVLEGGGEFPGRLSDDGLRMTFDDPKFIVTASGGYRFELLDREGMSGGGGRPLGNPRRARRSAQRGHRAAVGQSLRHAGGRRAAKDFGEGRFGGPRKSC